MRVDTMMQTQLITATPETSLAEVQRLMRDNNIRHVPVVSGKRLVGMITDRDVREASPSPATTLTRGEITYRMETTPIKTCMTKDVIWIGPDIDMVQGNASPPAAEDWLPAGGGQWHPGGGGD